MQLLCCLFRLAVTNDFCPCNHYPHAGIDNVLQMPCPVTCCLLSIMHHLLPVNRQLQFRPRSQHCSAAIYALTGSLPARSAGLYGFLEESIAKSMHDVYMQGRTEALFQFLSISPTPAFPVTELQLMRFATFFA